MTDDPASPAADPFGNPFIAVPGRARRDGWTPARQQRFLRALSECGTVAGAARVVGMSAKSAYRLRARAGEDSGFARLWDGALADAETQAISWGMTHAMQGETVPVFYGGRQVGAFRRHDTRVLLATLRAAGARADRSRDGARRSASGPIDGDTDRPPFVDPIKRLTRILGRLT